MKKLLLVTDSEWVVNDVNTALSLGGWAIDVMADPRQAANRVADSQPDAVVVDMQVGSMGGMAIIRSIRALMAASRHRIPRMVLLLDRSADRFLENRAHADSSVLKPIRAAEFRAALEPLATAIAEEE